MCKLGLPTELLFYESELAHLWDVNNYISLLSYNMAGRYKIMNVEVQREL